MNKELRKKWSANNRVKINATQKAWRKKNAVKQKLYRERYKESQRIKARERRKKNAERNKIYHKLWCLKNKDKRAMYEHKRRALKRGLSEHYTIEQIHDLYSKQKGFCAEPTCKKNLKEGYDVDHIHPLSKGGGNKIDNIQLLCGHCNSCKHSKHPLEWARQNGRLL